MCLIIVMEGRHNISQISSRCERGEMASYVNLNYMFRVECLPHLLWLGRKSRTANSIFKSYISGMFP